MPGDDWQKFANLRLLFGYMFAEPGKKLIFMGDEFGQGQEWRHDGSLDWDTADYLPQAGCQQWLRDLNRLYRTEPALHELDCQPAGFEWVDANDAESSTLSFLRKGKLTSDVILVVCNFTPVPREDYRVGVPFGGYWKELLNSDAPDYWGSGWGNLGGVEASAESHHGRPHSLQIALPPLGMAFFKGTPPEEE